MKKIIILILFIIVLCISVPLEKQKHNVDKPKKSKETYNNEKYCSAIYKAEGGKKAKKPYGILSVPCNGKEECRKICLNTVRNNKKRYKKYGYKDYNTFLEFLANRYAPVNCKNDNGTNKYWLQNVKHFLKNKYKLK